MRFQDSQKNGTEKFVEVVDTEIRRNSSSTVASTSIDFCGDTVLIVYLAQKKMPLLMAEKFLRTARVSSLNFITTPY